MFPPLISAFSCEESPWGVTTPQPAGPLSLRRALRHVHVVLLCLYSECSEQAAGALAQLVSAENACTTSLHFSSSRLNYLLDCFTSQVTCSTITMGDHADQ